MNSIARSKIDLGRAAFSLRLLFALFGLVASTAFVHAATTAAPTFNPIAGTYANAQTVTISSATSGAAIRYTTDGSTPSATAGTLYSSPVSIGVTTTLKAIAFKSGLTNSGVTSGTYTMKAAAPTFSPAAGTFTSVQTVSITSTTSSASIRYTTDGSAPSATAGTLYSGPVSIATTTTLKALAYVGGFTNSAVTSGTYTITAAAPVFSPAAGMFTSVQTVGITSTTSDASIRYTINGSAPSATAGTLYSGPVSIATTTTLKAIAFKTGFKNSTVTSGTYTIQSTSLEAESMSPVGTGATVSTSSDANASGGVIEFLNATAAGQLMTLTTPGIAAGTYLVQLRYKPNTARGQHTVKFDGIQLGGTIDQYATTSAYITAPLGIMTFASTGTHTIVLTVTGKNASASKYYVTADSFILTASPPLPPVIFSASSAAGQVGAVFSYQITASNSPTGYSAPGLPSGLSVNTSSGLITGTPTTTGTSSVTISASNSGGTGSAIVTLTVNPQPVTFTVSPVSFTYNGSAQGPVITPSVAGATYSTSGTASATAAGSYSMTADATGNYSGTSGSTAWTIAPATPVITWPAPAAITYGTALDSTQLNATANVPGTFAYTPAAGTVLAVGSQTLSVTFTPSDTTDYSSVSASVLLQVNAQPVTFAVSPVSFTYNGGAQGPAITPSVAGATYSISGTASATAAGSYSVTADANGNYSGTSGAIGWTIVPATPVVTWPAPAAITYGTALDSTQLNATANVPGTFAYTPAAGTVLGVGSQTLSVTFTPTDATDYNSVSASVLLQVNAQPVTFTVSPVSFTYNGSAQGPVITPSVAGATYSTSGTASATAAGSYSVTADANGNYSGTSGAIGWTIVPATPVVTWPAPAAITYGTALDSTQLNATANVPGTFAYTPAAGTVLGVGSQTLSVTFTPTDTADYSSVSASVLLTVNPPPPAAAPVFSPEPGTYTSAQTVTITSATTGASIRYTTDGSTPTKTIGTLYSGPVSISSTTTLQAVAYAPGFVGSPVTSGTYTITPSTAAPVFSPAAGTYASAQTVTITSATNGASIRYTTDGSTPTKTIGTLYSGPVSINRTTMLRAIAYGTTGGASDSPVSGGLYTITSSLAGVVNVLWNFTTSNNGGINPKAPLTLGSDGNFYGTTAYGGSANDGTVFEMTPAGVLTPLVTFTGANGSHPEASLVQGNDGNFYGTTVNGGPNGYGTVFQMSPQGSSTLLVSFNNANGAFPAAGLVQGSDGHFYGTTYQGGSANQGTVFKLTSSYGVWSVTTLFAFISYDPNGSRPLAPLVQGSDGSFYGTTAGPGTGSYEGSVFKIHSTGGLTTLYSFTVTNPNGIGYEPLSALVQGSDGNFYGTTVYGGSANDGTVFKMTPAGGMATLVSFSGGANGAYPEGALVQGRDGNFYGTTSTGGDNNDGTIFKMTPAGVLTTVISFDGANGANPVASLVQGSDGNFYGTTSSGGTSNAGEVFQLVLPQVTAPTFSPVADTYASAQSVVITSTTSGASIVYTTDGSTPTETNGTIYSGPVNIGTTTTLQAIAYESGFTDSPVTSGTYTITPSTAAPVFSPAAGTYASAQNVTISSTTSGASIRYTTDGSTPTATNGVLYSTPQPIPMGVTLTLKAFAFKIGFTDSTVTSGTYTMTPLASLSVSLTPNYAQWKLDLDGAWQTTGTILNNLPLGTHTIYFSDIEGYFTPVAVPITLNSGPNLLSQSYIPMASLAVSLTPNNAQWKLDLNGAWQNTFTVLNDLPLGTHMIYFSDVEGYITPGPVTITLNSGPNSLSQSYIPLASLAISLTPNNAQWRIDGGTWQNTFTVLNDLPLGAHTVYFSDVEGYITPGPVTITLNSGPNSLSQSYIPLASLAVSLTPNNAQWKLDLNGAWQNTFTVLNDLPLGAHTVYFSDIDGYITPGPVSITLNSGPNSLSQSYIPLASLAVSLTPGNAQWRIDGGAWQMTSTTLNNLPLGAHTVDYSDVTGYITPSSETVTLLSGPNTLTRSYMIAPPAAILNVLYNFTASNNGGIYPEAALVQGSDGNFYSTTSSGGSGGDGIVFKMTSAGVLTTLVSFNGANGAGPVAALVQGSDGNFYGTTVEGGSGSDGTIFKMTPTGVLTTLVSFSGANGNYPDGGLVQGSDGNFYGTTLEGGIGDKGTVFKMTSAGALTPLYLFTNVGGISAPVGLVQGSDGNFYVTTAGYISQMTPTGVFTPLVPFYINGIASVAALVQGRDGNFYGTTYNGGSGNDGTVFKMTPAGVLTTLVSFTGINGSYPQAGLVQGSDGNFYGTTKSGGSSNDGTIFQMTPAGVLTTLVSFTGTNGIYPCAGLVQGRDGNFYGTTLYGGSSGGGVIFQLIIPPTTAAPVFSPVPGTYAGPQTVTITSTTSGASIRYTTDGSMPTETNGTIYSGSVYIGTTTTLQAIAYASGYTDSSVTSGLYTINPPAAAPVFSPVSGNYTSAQTVTITSATSGASIRYTTDGSTPTETNGTIYSGPVYISNTINLQAIAYESGFSDSPVTSGTYTINIPQVAAPIFSPVPGTYTSAQTVTITSATSGASIRYTTDGSTPTETIGTIYSGPVYISSTTTLQAIAYESGFSDSPVTSGIYTIGSPVISLNVMYNFTTSGGGGINPEAALVQDSAGNFYGTNVGGGNANGGTAFAMTPAGVLTTLVSFNGPNGTYPYAGLVQDSAGNLYGTTELGGNGYGTIFKMTPAGALTTLFSFPSTGANGTDPTAGLVQGSDGNFYGTTQNGGSNSHGTIFKMTPAGVLTTLVLFSGTNGGNPEAALVQGSDGNLYGTTYSGGSGSKGTVFKMAPDGTLTSLVSFNGTNGAQPKAALVQGGDGNFYGTTQYGGNASGGTIFKMTPAGVLTTLVSFNGANGKNPVASLVQGSDGNFYGTTTNGGSASDGTIFEMTPDGVLTTLASFNGTNGKSPSAGLLQGYDGYFYGTTLSGGTANGGVVFQLTK